MNKTKLYYDSRAEVPEEYKWDLDQFIEKKNYEELADKTFKHLEKAAKLLPSMFDNKENFIAMETMDEDKSHLWLPLVSWVFSNKLNGDPHNAEIKTMMSKFSTENYKRTIAFAGLTNDYIANKEKVLEWIKDPRMKDYRRSYELLFRGEKHVVPKDISIYLKKLRHSWSNENEIFGKLSLDFKGVDAVDKDGNKHVVTSSSISGLMQSQDAVLRESAYKSWRNQRMQFKETLSALMVKNFKANSSGAKSINFNSSLESVLYSDDVNPKMLEMLYKKVKEEKALWTRIGRIEREVRSHLLGGKKVEKWDTSVNLFKNNKEYEIEEAKEIVFKALEPLGKEYAEKLKLLFDKRTIDFLPHKDKSSGAYSSPCYGALPVISMNWKKQLGDISTLIHELGHSMHSMFSYERQPKQTANYPIFLAEIASTFNEVMLANYIIKNSKSDQEKFIAINSMMGLFAGTIKTQVMFSEFEYYMMQLADKDAPIPNYDYVANLFHKVSSQYTTKPRKYKPEDNIISVTVPHFYRDFYVYKYAIGVIAALAFYNSNDYEKYIDKFLSAGGHDFPLEILKKAGLDMTKEEPYTMAMDAIRDLSKEYEELAKKLFNVTDEGIEKDYPEED